MDDLEVIIREYKPGDENRIKEICCDTGFLGDPIDSIFSDKELFTDLLVSPYLKYEADNAFVAEVGGRIVGYLLGSTRKDFDKKIRPVILKTAMKMVFRTLNEKYSNHPRTKEYIKWSLTKGWFQRAKHPKNSAHSHVNIEPNYRGRKIGSQLAIAFKKRMKEENLNRYYGIGIGSEARISLDKSLGMNVYSKKATEKFKPEFPDKTIYHVCTYLFTKPSEKYFSVSIHDFTPKYIKELSEIVEELEEREILPVNIILTPNYEEKYNIKDYPEFIKLVKNLRDKDCNIVSHGFNHVSKKGEYGSLTSFIKGVFFNIHNAEFETIDYQESKEKLEKSADILTDCGIETEG
ncbi:GNAT family N-acetyltransferase, partial [Candidatus Woesearchaeota archaeon]|nr:GNAT family N-acetyltransferase [Candidatus Woesearchaeota archaeon]